MTTRVDVAIVGGGIAGLCVADRLRRDNPDVAVRIYEASDSAGGKLLTERIDSDDGPFLVEAGADAWLAQKPWASELIDDLGLSNQVIPIARLPRPVAILKGGRLVNLPAGVSLVAPTHLWLLLRSHLLSPRGVARAAGDLVLRRKTGDADESLGSFVERRLGREALDWIAEPIAAGIYNADPDHLSLLATFPQLRRLEREHGSVIRGLRVKSRGSSGKNLPSLAAAGEGLGVRAGLEANGGWSPPLRNVVAGLRTRLGFGYHMVAWCSQRFVRGRPGMNSGSQQRMSAAADTFVSLGEAFAVSPGFQPGAATDGNVASIATRSEAEPKAGRDARHYVRSFFRAAGRLPSAPTDRPPTFLSLWGGMRTLVDALAERVHDAIELNASVTGIVAEPSGGYRLTFADRPEVLAGQVVLTVPAAGAAGLLADVAPDAAERLRELRAVHAGTISLAYRTADIPRPLAGYGLVIPKREGRTINAVTVASRKFAGRAPAGWELLRVFFGGYRSPATMDVDDSTLLDLVTGELHELLGITAPPAFHRISRWPAGSPQYDVGHLARIAAIEAALPAGIALTGSPYHGIGIPDVIHGAGGRAVEQ